MSSMHPSTRPPEKRFGIFFSLVFAALCAVGICQSWNLMLCIILCAASAVLLGLSLFAPHRLRPLNQAWYQFGMLINRIVSPLVLGLLFFGLLTPVAAIGRLFGRDELRLKRIDAKSYWIERDPPGPPGESFHNQF